MNNSIMRNSILTFNFKRISITLHAITKKPVFNEFFTVTVKLFMLLLFYFSKINFFITRNNFFLLLRKIKAVRLSPQTFDTKVIREKFVCFSKNNVTDYSFFSRFKFNYSKKKLPLKHNRKFLMDQIKLIN